MGPGVLGTCGSAAGGQLKIAERGAAPRGAVVQEVVRKARAALAVDRAALVDGTRNCSLAGAADEEFLGKRLQECRESARLRDRAFGALAVFHIGRSSPISALANGTPRPAFGAEVQRDGVDARYAA